MFWGAYNEPGHFPKGHVTEETPCDPLGVYGALKYAGEKIVKAYNQVFDLPYTIVRPFNCVGIGEGRALGSTEVTSGNVKLAMSHVVPDLVQKVHKGQDRLSRQKAVAGFVIHIGAVEDCPQTPMGLDGVAQGEGECRDLAVVQGFRQVFCGGVDVVQEVQYPGFRAAGDHVHPPCFSWLRPCHSVDRGAVSAQLLAAFLHEVPGQGGEY